MLIKPLCLPLDDKVMNIHITLADYKKNYQSSHLKLRRLQAEQDLAVLLIYPPLKKKTRQQKCFLL